MVLRSMALRVALLAGVASTTAASAAIAQDQWQDQVRNQLISAANAQGSGWSASHEIFYGSLRQSANQSWTIRLNAGTEYKILGRCDADCSDLDLRLSDETGRELVEDVDLDDYPQLIYTPSRTADFRLSGIMASCSVAPCRFGVAVFSRSGGAVQAGSSSDQWEQQVRAQLASKSEILTRAGYSMTHNTFVGQLRSGESTRLNLDLSGGKEYQIVGVCDADCSDFDLKLLDSRGTVLVSDVLTDDVPVLRYTVKASASYRIEAIMASCSQSPCRYGVVVYGK